MNATSDARGRHALRWVVGAGLVFVVVSGTTLETARRRAEERWMSVVTYWDEGPPRDGPGHTSIPISLFFSGTETRGGTVFQAWRRLQLDSPGFTIVLRQERNFFGSSVEARISRAGPGLDGMVEHIGNLFAPLDVAVVVEP